MNRGVAALGDQIFIATIDAHLVALDMRTGPRPVGHRGRRLQDRVTR